MRRQQLHIPILMVVIVLLTGRPMLFAEVLADIEVPHSFVVDGSSKFPEYNLFYKYYSNSNDAVVEVPIEDGKVLRTEAGAEAILVARKKTGGEDIVANRSLAGVEQTQSKDLTEVTEMVSIKKLTDDAFVVKINNYERHFKDGSTQMLKAHTGIAMVLNDPYSKELKIIMALSAPILVLVAMFMFQRNRRRRLKLAVGKVIRLKKRIQMRSTTVLRKEDPADEPIVEVVTE